MSAPAPAGAAQASDAATLEVWGADSTVEKGSEHYASSDVSGNPTRVEDASLFSRTMLWWLTMPVLRGLTRDDGWDGLDAPVMPSEFKVCHVGPAARKQWADELALARSSGRKASYTRVLWRMFKRDLTIALIWAIVQGMLSTVVKPLLLLLLIRRIDDGHSGWTVAGYIMGLSLSLFLEGISTANSRSYITDRFGSGFLASTAALIQQKAHRISPGTVSNEKSLLGNDCIRTYEVLKQLCLLPMAFSAIIGGLTMLIIFVGWPVVFGLTVILLILGISFYIGSRIKVVEEEVNDASDKRVGITAQIIEGIKAIKYAAWEEQFLGLVDEARKEELHWVGKHRIMHMGSIQLGRASPIVSACATFIGMAMAGKDLVPANVFAALTVFQSLRLALTALPMGVTVFQTQLVSLDRISAFLCTPEVEDRADADPADASDCNAAVRVNGCSFKYVTTDASQGCREPDNVKFVDTAGNFKLQLDRFSAKRGEITAVVGQVGSGKTSIISALLGDMLVEKQAADARMFVEKDVGYVPQRAFIICGSIKENILMGREFDRTRFHEAVVGAALDRDLESLPAKALTAIGERGVTLSGGQQQRVAVARALYGIPKLLLLDDPLAAVDSTVGFQIFNQVRAYTKKHNIATLIVLNQLHLLPYVDYVYMTEHGSIGEHGTYDELMHDDAADAAAAAAGEDAPELFAPSPSSGTALSPTRAGLSESSRGKSLRDFFAQSERSMQDCKKALVEAESVRRSREPASLAALVKDAEGEAKTPPPAMEASAVTLSNPVAPPAKAVESDEKKGKEIAEHLIRAEEKKQGSLSNSMYADYLKSMGACNAGLGTFICLLAYVCMGFADRWLARWIELQDEYRLQEEQVGGNKSLITKTFPDRDTYAAVYGSACTTMVICMVLSSYFLGKGTTRASLTLHEDVLRTLLHAPVSWFQETPSGRILSRLSSDLSVVDSSLAQFAEHCLNFFFTIIILFTIMVLVVPQASVVLVIASVIFVIQLKASDATNRDLKRLANARNGAVLTSLAESVHGQGRTLLRVMNFVDYTENKFGCYVDKMNRFNYMSAAVIAWQTLWCTTFSTLIASSTAVFMVWAPVSYSTSEVGLTLTYCFLLPYFFLFFSVVFSITRLNLTCLERLLQYTGASVDQEPAWHLDTDPTANNMVWPKTGEVSFESAELVYRPGLPPSLKGVNLQIRSGEKVGVVGRTGAGKSSLAVLLFRLVDASSGGVYIDGVDVRTVGLQCLRSCLGVIPQEPMLMVGTVRSNLDPFNEHTDAEVQNIMTRVGLDDVKMDMQVGASADTLSSGQRQLLSLARTLMRNVKIVVMDEPTSSIDPMTDSAVQRVIREEFKACTVITIAHRLHTIIDSDRVIVMDDGIVAEEGKPRELLQNTDSHLTKLVQDLEKGEGDFS